MMHSLSSPSWFRALFLYILMAPVTVCGNSPLRLQGS
jgi:hypothetical protein